MPFVFFLGGGGSGDGDLRVQFVLFDVKAFVSRFQVSRDLGFGLWAQAFWRFNIKVTGPSRNVALT